MAAKRQSLFAYFTTVSKQKKSNETDSSQGYLDRSKKLKQQSNKNRPENAGKCICESLEPQNFPGEHAPGHAPPDPPLGLRQIYPPVTLKYPLVQKLIETPEKGKVFFIGNSSEYLDSWVYLDLITNPSC